MWSDSEGMRLISGPRGAPVGGLATRNYQRSPSCVVCVPPRCRRSGTEALDVSTTAEEEELRRWCV